MLRLEKAFRVNENTVKVLYSHTELHKEFLVEWNNIDPNTGVTSSDYDLELNVLSRSDDFTERIESAIREGESDTNEDCELYLEIRDTFDRLDCENLE